MTPLATHVSVFLRERLPLERGASERTCDTYALGLRLFLEFAARQLKVRTFGVDARAARCTDGARVSGAFGNAATQRSRHAQRPLGRDPHLHSFH
jgi:hypothetical protein